MKINNSAGKVSTNIPKVGIKRLYFFINLVHRQDLDPIVKYCDELVVISVEK